MMNHPFDQTKPTSQTEWTVTDFGLVRLNGKDMVTALTYDQGKALVDAITEQLTAEREKFQKAKEWNRITELEVNNLRSLLNEIEKVGKERVLSK